MESAENEKKKLLEEISELKQQLLWYKRTYEQRSLIGIIKDRVLGGKIKTSGGKNVSLNKILSRVKINKRKGSRILPRRIFCAIVNHNYNENSSKLYNTLVNYFDTVIFDSGSTNPPRESVKLPNIYYSGLLNAAYEVSSKNGYDFLLFICSDVMIEPEEAAKLYQRLSGLDFDKIALYSPSSTGGDHSFCRRQTADELRTVPFVEGFMFLCDLKILGNFCPINTQENLYGWGLDIAKGYYARKSNKLSVIDDNVLVQHTPGTGYSRETAEFEMLSWLKTLRDRRIVDYFEEQMDFIKNSNKDRSQKSGD
jgi:hypothetical protein